MSVDIAQNNQGKSRIKTSGKSPKGEGGSNENQKSTIYNVDYFEMRVGILKYFKQKYWHECQHCSRRHSTKMN